MSNVKPEEAEKDEIRREPLLILTLSLLIGAAFHQGVFQEFMAQAGAMGALCLLHIALMGQVQEIGKTVVALSRRFRRTAKGPVSPPDANSFDEDELSCALLAAESALERREKNRSSSKEISVWSSGQWLAISNPSTVQPSRV